jgi:hypothetical protein
MGLHPGWTRCSNVARPLIYQRISKGGLPNYPIIVPAPKPGLALIFSDYP